MEFQQVTALYFIPAVLLLWFLVGNVSTGIEALFAPEVLAKITVNKRTILVKTRLKLLLLSMLLMLLALGRPSLLSGEIEVKRKLSDLVIAIDISASMLADDIYPNRFEFAKNKLLTNLHKLENMRIGLLGFASQAFLISPLSDDLSSLQFLIKNLKLNDVNRKGTDFTGAMQATNDLLEEANNKQLLLLTDGGEGDFKAEIDYANAHNLQVFIYDITTKKGSTINIEGDVLKDDKGNIVIVRENQNIKNLSKKTNGSYLKYSLNSKDLSSFINRFKQQTSNKITHIRQFKELFYYPLAVALLLLLMVFFSLPKKKK
ncbi:TPR domain protein in aerotolerance operon [uncultured Candidatus Thioglobus sp.]|nr:TPR domain protein in aerotolerance operon [uncultured Candidatus Thioglobus sp.]